MKQINGLITFIGGLILFILVSPFGFLWGWVGKPIYEMIKGKENWKESLYRIWDYFKRFVVELWKTIDRMFYYMALVIDYLGNVIAGELLEDTITPREITLFGVGGCPISASIGELEYYGYPMTKFGKNLSLYLNKIFKEEAHCINAYKAYIEWTKSK